MTCEIVATSEVTVDVEERGSLSTAEPVAANDIKKPAKPQKQHQPKQSKEREAPMASPSPDPFDPASLRLNTDYLSTTSVEKVRTSVPVKRPDKQQFVRVHPNTAMRIDTAVLKFEEDGQTYLVQPALRHLLADQIQAVTLFTAVDRAGNVILWPVRLPGADGRTYSWFESARVAAEIAIDHWVRVKSDMQAKSYVVERALGDLGAPEWPKESLAELLRLAFQERNIASDDHPIVRKLKGLL